MRMEAIPISEEEASVLGERFVVLVRVFHRWLPSQAWSFSSLGNGWRFTYKGGAGRVVVERVLDLEHSLEHFEDRGVSSFDEVLRESEGIWDERWRGDIEIDGPIEDQQVIRSFLFYLYANGSEKLPPMGLSDGRYKGHRFWDAEGWMLPVYAFLAPAVAREATEWRVGALRKLARSSLWLRVPWEMGVVGDQTPPAFREAIHVGGWVFWWLERAKALGFIGREDAEDVQLKIVRFFSVRSIEKGGKFHLLGVVSPDEGRFRDNDLVTNMLAKYCALTAASAFVGISEEERKNLQDFAQRLVIPMVGAVPATYESDPLMTYQQASALLTLFPFEWDFGKEINEAMFDRYKDRISPLGPAMSDSIHSVIASRLGRGEEAYRYWRRSWEPFLRAWMGYSERRNSDRVYFLTGAAGCVEAVLYGFLGIRVWGSFPSASSRVKEAVSARGERSVWKPLGNGYYFEARNQLPPKWKRVRVKGLWLLGKRYTLEATHGRIRMEEEGE